MTPYYDDGQAVIWHGDVREITFARPREQGAAGTLTGEIVPGSVACCVTSPPYNVGLGYDQADDVLPWNEYAALAADVGLLVGHSLVEGGRSWVNVTPVVPTEPLAPGDHSGRCYKRRRSLLGLWADALEAEGNGALDPWDVVCWPTPGRGPGTAWGSWASPSAPNLRGEWEAILVHYKGTWGRETPPEWKGWKDDLGGWTPLTSNVWKMQPQARDLDHPAPFPLELPQAAIRLSTWPGETVLDPFMGTGSTLVAAKALGRKAVGIELSEAYCEIAAKRLAQGAFDFGDAS